MCLMAGTCVNRAGASEWTFDASAFVFDPRRDNAFVSPVLSAGRGTLHLEARWNYEDLDTGSLFLGHTFEFGGSVSGSVAPMIGVVAGATDGLAPGLELEIGWRRFLFSSESEVILDAHDADDNFLFTWLEGTVEAGRGVSLGFAAQRTKAFETGLDLQRGPMLAYAAERGWLGLYWFNPDRSDDQMLVLGGGWTF
jgi:hypothetical protein